MASLTHHAAGVGERSGLQQRLGHIGMPVVSCLDGRRGWHVSFPLSAMQTAPPEQFPYLVKGRPARIVVRVDLRALAYQPLHLRHVALATQRQLKHYHMSTRTHLLIFIGAACRPR
jgi:hypothetical protein